MVPSIYTLSCFHPDCLPCVISASTSPLSANFDPTYLNVFTLSNGGVCSTSILELSEYAEDAVSKLQVAILARSSREMSQIVRIDCRHILSQVRVSVRPRNVFIREIRP